MNYDVKKLYIGLVEYYKKNIKVLELHTLYDEMGSDKLMDLNFERPIPPNGNDQRYYKRSLISFNEILMRSKINYGHLNREDALKILEQPPLSEEEGEKLFSEVADKLQISNEELMNYFNLPKCKEKFKNQNRLYNFGIRLYEILGLEKRIRK